MKIIPKMPHIMLALIIISAILISGCTTTQSGQTGSRSFEQTISLPEQHYRPDGSCYYTSLIDVKNSGQGPAMNVMIRCALKDPVTGDTVDSESRFFEVIDEGDHKAFTVSLDGECNMNYAIGVDVTEDYK
ncbi:MAG: hypothetical protein JXQ82_09745 [Methanomicrobiaceae archaeon]|nr:hypothetical protein [Methanomicrobiaceae archaeon]